MPILVTTPFQPGSFERILASCGGTPRKAFVGICHEITQRYLRQLSEPPPSDAYLHGLWGIAWEILHGESLPRPLAPNEVGEPRTLPDSYLADITERILGTLPRQRSDDTLRILMVQTVTALLSPEFRACRQSFLSPDPAGECPRQSVDHCRDRVSGAHCEDCPFFVALGEPQHRKLLGRAFGAGRAADWENHSAIFLPEDFRALRVFWHLYLRQPRHTP